MYAMCKISYDEDGGGAYHLLKLKSYSHFLIKK